MLNVDSLECSVLCDVVTVTSSGDNEKDKWQKKKTGHKRKPITKEISLF